MMTDWFQTIFLDCQEAPLLSVRALPVPPPPPSVSACFSPLCLISVSPAFLFPSPTPLLASPSLPLWSESLHSAQTLLLHRSLSLALSWKDLVDKGAGVKRFPVSWWLADPRTVRWCRVPGDGEMRGTHCQARPSSSSSSSSRRCNHNTHSGPPVTACLAQNGLVYSLCASLPVRRTSDRPRATVARLNETSVSHSAPPDWTPAVSAVHRETNTGWTDFSHYGMQEGWRKRHAGSGRMHLTVDWRWWWPCNNINNVLVYVEMI